jgi:hypothetical protein
MAAYSHERPGWYKDPDDPRRLRYWDGTTWTGRSRKRPPWAARTEAFEARYEELDRSIEGPVHPRELREPVASGAWSREWLSWRGRPPLPGWHRRVGEGGAGVAWTPRSQPSTGGRPARRPLLAVVSVVVVAVAVVVSSVAVITPYQDRQVATQQAVSRFAVLASKDCRATLPKYRAVLVSGVDAPNIDAAAREVDLLRQRLSRLPAGQLISATVVEWLEVWGRFTASERRYAALVRPRLGAPSLALKRARQERDQWASLADELSANLQLSACRLEPAPS